MAATEPTLSAFITRDHHAIIDEFTSFARTLVPPDSPMTEQELRDHSKELLQAIALDLETQQTNHEQAQKSKGLGAAHMMRASGRLHADARLHHGFGLMEVLSEFRALRASVLRLYAEIGASDLTEVRRFNEAIDEALTESMHQFASEPSCFGRSSMRRPRRSHRW